MSARISRNIFRKAKLLILLSPKHQHAGGAMSCISTGCWCWQNVKYPHSFSLNVIPLPQGFFLVRPWLVAYMPRPRIGREPPSKPQARQTFAIRNPKSLTVWMQTISMQTFMWSCASTFLCDTNVNLLNSSLQMWYSAIMVLTVTATFTIRNNANLTRAKIGQDAQSLCSTER